MAMSVIVYITGNNLDSWPPVPTRFSLFCQNLVTFINSCLIRISKAYAGVIG